MDRVFLVWYMPKWNNRQAGLYAICATYEKAKQMMQEYHEYDDPTCEMWINEEVIEG